MKLPNGFGTVYKFLIRDLLQITDLLDDCNRLTVCCVGLGTCLLDTEAASEHRFICDVHFACLIRMQSMCNVYR
jgi:hypothetical protein